MAEILCEGRGCTEGEEWEKRLVRPRYFRGAEAGSYPEILTDSAVFSESGMAIDFHGDGMSDYNVIVWFGWSGEASGR